MTPGQFDNVNWDAIKEASAFVLKGSARRIDGDDWAVYRVTTQNSDRLVIDIKFDANTVATEVE